MLTIYKYEHCLNCAKIYFNTYLIWLHISTYFILECIYKKIVLTSSRDQSFSFKRFILWQKICKIEIFFYKHSIKVKNLMKFCKHFIFFYSKNVLLFFPKISVDLIFSDQLKRSSMYEWFWYTDSKK